MFITSMIFAAALPMWATILIAVAAVLVVGGLMYVVFRWGMKNKTVSNLTLSGASAVFSVLQSVFKDKPDEVDAHDFMKALEALSKAGLDALKGKEEGLSFDQLKENMKERIWSVVKSFPKLSESVSEEYVDKAADAFFVVIGCIPQVSDVVKK